MLFRSDRGADTTSCEMESTLAHGCPPHEGTSFVDAGLRIGAVRPGAARTGGINPPARNGKAAGSQRAGDVGDCIAPTAVMLGIAGRLTHESQEGG